MITCSHPAASYALSRSEMSSIEPARIASRATSIGIRSIAASASAAACRRACTRRRSDARRRSARMPARAVQRDGPNERPLEHRQALLARLAQRGPHLQYGPDRCRVPAVGLGALPQQAQPRRRRASASVMTGATRRRTVPRGRSSSVRAHPRTAAPAPPMPGRAAPAIPASRPMYVLISGTHRPSGPNLRGRSSPNASRLKTPAQCRVQAASAGLRAAPLSERGLGQRRGRPAQRVGDGDPRSAHAM